MKIWSSEYTFSHPWQKVVTASLRKYPNPMNPAVVGVDVIERQTHGGILKSHRVISTDWGMPQWAIKILGSNGICYAIEKSEIDIKRRSMTMHSENLSFTRELSIMEKVVYTPHPTDPDSTLLKQEAVITVHGVPLSNYIENFISSIVSKNAYKGRQAIELLINTINI